jgi:hypothetical protein
MPNPDEDRCDRPAGEPTTAALLEQSRRLQYLSRIAAARSVALAETSWALMRRSRELLGDTYPSTGVGGGAGGTSGGPASSSPTRGSVRGAPP